MSLPSEIENCLALRRSLLLQMDAVTIERCLPDLQQMLDRQSAERKAWRDRCNQLPVLGHNLGTGKIQEREAYD